jgi:hypothetical protein
LSPPFKPPNMLQFEVPERFSAIVRIGASLKHSASSCALVAAILCFAAASAQQPQAFHWDWQISQELTYRQSLRDVKIPSREKQAIAAAVIRQLRPVAADLEIQSPDHLKKAALDTRVKLIDLNHDGTPEVIAQSIADCSPTGNCSLWVFQKTRGNYKLLLEGFGQTFTIQKTSTRGYRDIVVAAHSSAAVSGLTNYRYRDGAYHEAGCYSASWHVPEGDAVRMPRAPIVTPFPCDDHP